MSDVDDDDDTSSIDAATTPGASGGVTLAPLTRDPWMVIFRLSVGGKLISDFSSHRCATNQSPMSVGRLVGWLGWGFIFVCRCSNYEAMFIFGFNSRGHVAHAVSQPAAGVVKQMILFIKIYPLNPIRLLVGRQLSGTSGLPWNVKRDFNSVLIFRHSG